MRLKLHNIPIWLINLITVVSGTVAILTPVIAVIFSYFINLSIDFIFIITCITLSMFLVILFLRMKKYRALAMNRMEKTSDNYYRLSREIRDTYFDILHSHKKNTLTIQELSVTYKNKLSLMLDNLCDVLNSFTERKISACIKLITYPTNEEIIDETNATLFTFCRSHNSDSRREAYETRKKILLIENTDFEEIISQDNDKEYFYQGNLIEFDKQLEQMGKKYKNTNDLWKKYYKATIVVPIRIEFKRLYHQKNDDKFHIIGFVCVDTLSTDAFTKEQEKYNVDIVKSFADAFYILLGQYRHYLRKLSETVDLPSKKE